MSVLRFFNNPEDNENKEYKTGKIKDLEFGEFKYYEVNRDDISKRGDLKIGVDLESKVICTSVDYDFNTDTVIILDGHEYSIRSFYIERFKDDNNFFNISCKKRTYLTLIMDR